MAGEGWSRNSTTLVFQRLRPLGRAGHLVWLLAVSAEDLRGDVKALRDFANRSEALLVKEKIVLEVDKHLRRARIRPRGGKDNRAARVKLLDGIVSNTRVAIFCIQSWVAGEAKLADEVGDDAEKARVVVEALVDQVLEALHANRCPLRVELSEDTGNRVWYIR